MKDVDTVSLPRYINFEHVLKLMLQINLIKKLYEFKTRLYISQPLSTREAIDIVFNSKKDYPNYFIFVDYIRTTPCKFIVRNRYIKGKLITYIDINDFQEDWCDKKELVEFLNMLKVDIQGIDEEQINGDDSYVSINTETGFSVGNNSNNHIEIHNCYSK